MLERGIRVTQSYGSADLGSIAYESLDADGSVTPGMILDEGLLLEIVRPGTGDAVPVGEVGEVVITTFNRDYPLIRFGTGDLSAILPGTSPCGRTNTRIRGWMGRADQTTKVRAMFVTPKQVNEVVRRHPEILKARLVVEGETGDERMTLRCEVKGPPEALAPFRGCLRSHPTAGSGGGRGGKCDFRHMHLCMGKRTISLFRRAPPGEDLRLEVGPLGIVLEDGARVSIVGGGPAGSLYAFFLQTFAERMDLRIAVDISTSTAA